MWLWISPQSSLWETDTQVRSQCMSKQSTEWIPPSVLESRGTLVSYAEHAKKQQQKTYLHSFQWHSFCHVIKQQIFHPPTVTASTQSKKSTDVTWILQRDWKTCDFDCCIFLLYVRFQTHVHSFYHWICTIQYPIGQTQSNLTIKLWATHHYSGYEGDGQRKHLFHLSVAEFSDFGRQLITHLLKTGS